MKRIRKEHIGISVDHYLKKRQFSDGAESGPQVKPECIKVHDMSLAQAMRGQEALAAAIAFSSLSVEAVDVQFNRLKNFVLDCEDPLQTELRSLLYPLFVHTYLELLSNGHKNQAHKFFGRNQSQFKSISGIQNMLELLQNMGSKQDVLASQPIREFREHKFIVSLSEVATEYLFRFLKAEDNTWMLQLCNRFIHIQPTQKDANYQVDDPLLTGNGGRHTPEPAKPPLLSAVKDVRVTLDRLRKSIARVKRGRPSAPSVCFYTFLNAYQGLCCCEMSPEKSSMSAGFEDSTVRVWSLTPSPLRAETAEVDVSRVNLAGDFIEDEELRTRPNQAAELKVMRGHSGPVYSLAYTRDNGHLLSASEDSTIRLWDLSSYKNRVCYQGHNYSVWDVDMSPVGDFFASCSMDSMTKIWSTDRTFPLRSLIGHLTDVNVVKYHPNGNYLATGSSDRTVRLWDAQQGQTVRLMQQGHKARVCALAFSPCGKYLASAGEDYDVLVWELSTGSVCKELKGHTGIVHTLAFNQDSTMLASGGLDGTLKIWRVFKDGTENNNTAGEDLLTSFNTPAMSIQFLRYSKKGILLAAGGQISS